jgi:hypothetical protein
MNAWIGQPKLSRRDGMMVAWHEVPGKPSCQATITRSLRDEIYQSLITNHLL